jgi:multidrug efflux pump subunit AcrB
MGLDLGALSQTLHHRIQGAVPTLYKETDRQSDIRLRNRELDRNTLEDIRSLVVGERQGVPIRLASVHINMYRRRGEPREEAMIHGGRVRLRPILMTATTTLLSLVPIVVQKPTLAGVYYYSMALVIMGGLAVSTFLTLVLRPAPASGD